jgi:hypothetical protein
MSMPTPQFGSMLADILHDFETESATAERLDDAVERLSLAAMHSVAAQNGGPLPRAGLNAYLEGGAAAPRPVQLMLDVKF